MKPRTVYLLACTSVVGAGLAIFSLRATAAEESAGFEMHQWGVWLAQAGTDKINARDEYPSSVPWLAVTSRPRAAVHGQPAPSPLGMLTFYGKPAPQVEVEVQIANGTILGSWPAASRSAVRLRWLGYSLAAGNQGNLAGAVEFPANWFTPAKADGALALRTYAGRGERFLSYDFEATWKPPIRLEGGPENYILHNLSDEPLYDVVVVAPGTAGPRLAWLDELPPAKNVEAARPIQLSEPLPVGSGPFLKLTSQALSERLKKTGLNRQEIEFLVSHYKAEIFGAAALRTTFRLSPKALNDLAPATVEPKPAKSVFATLVIVDDVDPNAINDLKLLVQQLGSRSYQERETAEKRLLALRAQAIPAVSEAVNAVDPEVAYRAERILVKLQQPNDPFNKTPRR